MTKRELIEELKKIELQHSNFFKGTKLDDYILMDIPDNTAFRYTVINETIAQWELVKKDLANLKHKIITS